VSTDQGSRRYSDAEAKAILDQALRHESTRGIEHEDLVAAAREIGIAPEAIERATRELEQQRALEHEEKSAKAVIYAGRRFGLLAHFVTFATVNFLLLAVNFVLGGGYWFFWPLLGWGVGVFLHLISALSRKVSPEELSRELARMRARAERERQRQLREAAKAAARARRSAIARNALDLGAAVESGVASLLANIAGRIQEGVGPIVGEPPRPQGPAAQPFGRAAPGAAQSGQPVRFESPAARAGAASPPRQPVHTESGDPALDDDAELEAMAQAELDARERAEAEQKGRR